MKSKQLWHKLQNRPRQWLSVKKIQVLYRWLRMTTTRFLPRVSEGRVQQLHQELSKDATWGTNFIVCTVCACLIATFGLISNSTAVIIGAMLVAPLMLPLRGLAFSACESDFELFRKAFMSITGATILSLIISSLIGKLISIPNVGSEIVARTQPNLIDLGIAISAGGLSGFAKIRQGISDTLAGTAIAVALMPPLCVVGLSLSANYYSFATGAFLLYITNLLGITLACMLVFIIGGYTKINQALSWTSLLTFFLVIPLGGSFFRLVEQKRIETEIINKLINETITIGENTNNIRVGVIWTKKPPLVYVYLETHKAITANQVQLVEDFLNQRMQQEFNLILYVIPVQEIGGEEEQNLPKNDSFLNQKNYSFPDSNFTPLLNKYPK